MEIKVLLKSQYRGEADELAQRVALPSISRTLAQPTPEEAFRAASGHTIEASKISVVPVSITEDQAGTKVVLS